MTAEPGVPLRADARRNRDQIVAAARTIFGSRGPEVPMEEIARAAGVGVGTLYRRFPDRDALIRAVALDSFARVIADARTAAAEERTAWQALVRLLHQSAELQLGIQLAMLSPRALAVLKSDAEALALRDELLAEVERLVAVAQREGRLRADVGPGDIALLFSLLLSRVRATSPEAAAGETSRCIAIMVDGLRATSATPLPGRPLSVGDLGR
jgi:AcrR family transcriptional regulator